MAKNKDDIFWLATDTERDKIIDLVGNLPPRFFGDLEGWEQIVEELHEIIVKIKERGIK